MRRSVSLVTEPNVVPMIDVLLVLLIMFMITVVVPVRRTLDLTLPESGGNAGEGASIVLSVEKGPRYILNGRDLPATNLEGALHDVFRERKERVLFVKGERSLTYQDVVHAFDAARGAGIVVTAVVPGTVPPR